MAEPLATRMELGRWPLAQRIGRYRGKPGMQVAQFRLLRQNLHHLLRVVLPVGRAVDNATVPQPAGQALDEGRRDQPPLVVPRLRPGIRKEDVNAR